MRFLSLALASSLSFAAPAFACDDHKAADTVSNTSAAASSYGAKLTGTEALPLSQALATYDAKTSGDVVVTGEIRKVCQAEGCWMEIAEGNAQARVTFKDHGFVIPKDLAGRKVKAQGRIVEKTETVAQQKHFLKDAGASKTDIAAVKTPRTTKSFVATGVELLN